MSIKDVLGWSVGVTLLILCVFAAVMVTTAFVEPSAFSKGYCTALGGVPIDSTTCNVDGKVVPVPSWR
jgi:hypothetical protein